MRLTAVLLLLLMAATAQAQSGSTSGSILGRLLDAQKAVIAGASVEIRQLATNSTRVVESDENGLFSYSQLPPGDYELTVNLSGFEPYKNIVTLTLGSTLLAELQLKTAGTEDLIVIRADRPIKEVKIESSIINNRTRINDLPINRRDFLDFSQTAPRVTADRVPNQGVLSTSGLSFNGQSGRFNNITIDGLNNNETNQGAVRSTFSQEAVQEFQVVSDNYSAEFGRSLAGIVNIVTRSGNNTLQGNLFLLNRNDKISARDAFAGFKPPYSQYQFGATLGGPVKKDRLFYFTSFERLTIKQNNIVTISDATIASARRLGYQIDNGPVAFGIGTTSLLARFDAKLSDNDTIWVRYNGAFASNGAFEPFGGLISDSSSGRQSVDDNTVAFSNTFISAALNLVNETRLLYSRREQSTRAVNSFAGVQLVAPEGTITFGQAGFLPEFNDQRIYQIINNSSLARGRHQIKFGFDANFINRPRNPNGALFSGGFALFAPLDFAMLSGQPGLPAFSGLEALDPTLRTPQQRAFLTILSFVLPTMGSGFPAGVPLADLPIPTVYAQGFGTTQSSVSERLFSIYAQDDFRVRANLLLKAGLRYDLNRVDFTPDNNGNISPRVGIAYRPARFSNVNLHAAFGLFFATPFTRATISSLASADGLKVILLPFPNAVLPFARPGHNFPVSQSLPAGVQFIPQLNIATQLQPDLRNSYSVQSSAGIDYQLDAHSVLSLNYNYLRGVRLISLRNINPVVRPLGDPLQSLIVGRLDNTRGDLFEFESAFDSYYHGFTISLNRRLAERFTLLAHYTFSKSIDNIADFSVSVTDRQDDPLQVGRERGLSLQDTRSRFVLSGSWHIGYRGNILLRDFQLATIISSNSGRPYNLLAGVDLNQNGDGGIGDRPAGLGRNTGVTPGFASFDLRVTRAVVINDRTRVEGFVEAFNLFNRVNIDPNAIDRAFPPNSRGQFNLPPQDNGRFIFTPDRFRGSLSARQFQLGLKLSF